MVDPDISTDFDVMTIEEFCRRYKFSEGHYFQQARLGRMPRVLKIGGRTLIPHEAIAEWKAALLAAPARQSRGPKPKVRDVAARASA